MTAVSQNPTITRYLKKRGFKGPWSLKPLPQKKYRIAVIIPALAEYPGILHTLDSLAAQPSGLMSETIVVVVINHGDDASRTVRENNIITLSHLLSESYPFHLSLVDAASPGRELPSRFAGVGLARKIGHDLILPFMTEEGLLFSTDADCILKPDYLESTVINHGMHRWNTAVLGFRHQTSQNPKIEAAIRLYEDILESTAENLLRAGSPYAYPPVGSTVVCSVKAYCAVGGMPKRKATEDFYFLQELAKYDRVHRIPKVLVHPSPRPETRLFLGTGFRMTQSMNGGDLTKLYYSNESFTILKQWLKLAVESYDVRMDQMLKLCLEIHEHLPVFLQDEKIQNTWEGLQKSSPSKTHFIWQFHRWFDGLKTIRLLKTFTLLVEQHLKANMNRSVSGGC